MGSPSRFSRRAFIGLAAGAAAVPVVTAGCQSADSGGAPKSGARPAASRRGPVPENSLPGDPRWDIRHLGDPDAMLGYAGQASVLPGEPITLYASTTGRSFTVTAFRMGWYGGDLARKVWRSGTVTGHKQNKPVVLKPANTVETRWDPSVTIPTHDWPEGSYLLRMDSEAGAQRFVPVTVRSAKTAGKTVIKNSVETWQAYNMWGGYDLYNGPGGITDYKNRSLAVSLDRPYDRQGAFMFLYHERRLIELAERLGMPLAYTTSQDIEADPHVLDGASALFSLGHDEYWSPPERASVTAARNAGVNIAFLGANCMFRRTRLASTRLGPRRLVICYKTSYLQDPMYGKHNALVTSDWREPPHPDPESSLTGTLYESNPVSAPYVVAVTARLDVRRDRGAEGHQVPRAGGHRIRPGQPRLTGRAAHRDPLPLAGDLPRREQLRGLGVLHPPRRRGGVQRGDHALGGLVRRPLPVRHEPAYGRLHPARHGQPAASVRRRRRREVPGA